MISIALVYNAHEEQNIKMNKIIRSNLRVRLSDVVLVILG